MADDSSGIALPQERRRRQAAGEERHVQAGPYRLSYWERGRGRPFVLLHGLGGSAYDWRHNLDPLADAGYRVLAFDLLGAGQASKILLYPNGLPAG